MLMLFLGLTQSPTKYTEVSFPGGLESAVLYIPPFGSEGYNVWCFNTIPVYAFRTWWSDEKEIYLHLFK
jgi:hypothetical protein